MVGIEGLHGRGSSYPAPDDDAIVVGAGPAGSVTALLLARRGLAVRLVDRSDFPRPKPCGDCLSAAATRLLDRLDLLTAVRDAGASVLRGWSVTAPGGARASGALPDPPALALERRVLDDVLLRAALAAGARFERGTIHDLRHDSDTGRVRGVALRLPDGRRTVRSARLVVGADGLRSVVARRLGVVRRPPRTRKASLTVHLGPVPGLENRGEMHVLEDGCIGIAPAGLGRTNLTVVASGPRLGDLRRQGPDAFLRGRVAERPDLARRLRRAGLRDHPLDEILTSGPFDRPVRSPVARGAALVGDAAGYFDPFTGQGIHHAMAAAELLASAVGPALAAGPRDPGGGTRTVDAALDAALETYARRKRRLTRPIHRLQRAVDAVLSRPRLADGALGRLARAPLAMDRLVEVTGDLRAPVALLSPRVLSSFIFPSSPESP